MRQHRIPAWFRAFLVGILAVFGLSAATAVPASATGVPGALHAPQRPQAAAHLPDRVGPVQGLRRVSGQHPRTGTEGPGGGNTELDQSDNWGGYAVNDDTFTNVSAEWTEPAARCDSNVPTQWAVFWVGLDGFGNSSVEQGGSEAICNYGTPTYEIWWEMYPYNDIVSTATISAGDTIQASVTYNPATTDFTIKVNDLTNNASIDEVTPCEPGMGGCPRATAEVIAEAPSGGDDLSNLYPLTDFRFNTFNDSSVTDANGHTGTLSDATWQTNEIDEVSILDVTQQQADALSPDGSSFEMVWEDENGAGVALSYETPVTSATTTRIEPWFKLINYNPIDLDLSDVTIDYYFTQEGGETLTYACDYAQIGCSNVTGSFSTISGVTGADHIMQVSFTSGAGELAPGDTGPIENAFYETPNYPEMTQTNDYSFNANDTTFTTNPDITVWYEGWLVFGYPPPPN